MLEWRLINPEDAVSKYYICKRYRTNNFLQKMQRIRRISNTLHASQLYTPKCIPEALFPQIRQNGSSRGSEDGTYFSRFRFRLLTPSGRSFPVSVLSDFDTSILFLYSDYKEMCMHVSVVYNATDFTTTKYSIFPTFSIILMQYKTAITIWRDAVEPFLSMKCHMQIILIQPHNRRYTCAATYILHVQIIKPNILNIQIIISRNIFFGN